MKKFNLFFSLIILAILSSCSVEDIANEVTATPAGITNLNCSTFEAPDNSTYESLTFDDLKMSDLNSSNIGLYHNVLLNDFFREVEYSDTDFDGVVEHYDGLLKGNENVSLEGFENLEDIDISKPETVWVAEDAGFTAEEKSFIYDIVDIINDEAQVVKVQEDLARLKQTIKKTNIASDRKEVLFIGLSIAEHSYKFWAPAELGGDDNERRIRCYLGQDEVSSRAKWGEWFAKTATSDITSGLSGAMRAAYLGPQGWLGAGLFSAAVGSTATGIMSWP